MRGAIAGIAAALLIAGGILWVRRSPSQAAATALPAAAAPPRPGPSLPISTPRRSASGNVSATMAVVELTPAAQIQAEKFRCICGCKLSLGECYCSKSPGSVEMKRTLQDLVNKGLTPAEIEKAMVGKYGPSVTP